jgi:hypothetical protein
MHMPHLGGTPSTGEDAVLIVEFEPMRQPYLGLDG